MKAMLVVLFAMMFAITGCSTTTLKTENTEKRKVLSWYVDHAEAGKEGWIPGFRTPYMYAVAQDVSPSAEMAMRKATLKAKAKLADKVAGEITNRTTLRYTESGAPQQPTGSADSQDIIVNMISESVLKYYEIEDKDLLYNPELGNYRAFVLVKITKENLDQVEATYKQKKANANVRKNDQTLDEAAAEVLTQAN